MRAHGEDVLVRRQPEQAPAEHPVLREVERTLGLLLQPRLQPLLPRVRREAGPVLDHQSHLGGRLVDDLHRSAVLDHEAGPERFVPHRERRHDPI